MTTTDTRTTVTYQPAEFPTACTRLRWFATCGTARASLNVAKLDGRAGYKTTWVGDRGAGWGKRFSRTFATESDATMFGAIKASMLITWIEKQAPCAERNGAADAFSAQVSGMRR